jgi:hypothetical protein
MTEHSLLPENLAELEPLGLVTVGRYEVLAYRLDGTPIADPSEIRQFKQLKDALDWSVGSPRHLHQFKIPISGASLSAFLSVDPETFQETLTLSSGERSVTVPKAVKKVYAAVTDNESLFNLYISLDPKETSVFGSDFAWINLTKEGGAPTLNFTLNPGFYTTDELAVDLTYMIRRVGKVVDQLLDGVDTNHK